MRKAQIDTVDMSCVNNLPEWREALLQFLSCTVLLSSMVPMLCCLPADPEGKDHSSLKNILRERSHSERSHSERSSVEHCGGPLAGLTQGTGGGAARQSATGESACGPAGSSRGEASAARRGY